MLVLEAIILSVISAVDAALAGIVRRTRRRAFRRAQSRRRRHDDRRARPAASPAPICRIPPSLARCAGSWRARRMAAIFGVADARARGQSGGDRAGADHLRRRPFRPDRRGFVGQKIVPAPHLHLPILTDLPVVGRILFGEDAFVYVSIALIIGIWLFLYRTRAGLDTARGRRQSRLGACARLSGAQDSHAGRAVRRRLRRARRRAICRSPIRRSSFRA